MIDLEINKNLIGALIGLIKAIEGNEDIINDNTNNIIKNAILAFNTINHEEIIDILHDEKKRLIPDCLTCKTPCGKGLDYDVNDLILENPKIIEIKIEILNKIYELALNDKLFINMNVIYIALYSINMSYKYESFEKIINQINKINSTNP